VKQKGGGGKKKPAVCVSFNLFGEGGKSWSKKKGKRRPPPLVREGREDVCSMSPLYMYKRGKKKYQKGNPVVFELVEEEREEKSRRRRGR